MSSSPQKNSALDGDCVEASIRGAGQVRETQEQFGEARFAEGP